MKAPWQSPYTPLVLMYTNRCGKIAPFIFLGTSGQRCQKIGGTGILLATDLVAAPDAALHELCPKSCRGCPAYR